MAITAAALQTELGDGDFNKPRVVGQYNGEGGTLQYWRIRGGTSYPGREINVVTTAADAAADQAVTVLAALLAGPA